MKRFVFSFMVLCLIWTGCTVSEEEAKKREQDSLLTLMTWNVHNLFDGTEDGLEYPEFRQESGWSEEKYLGRINSIAAAISVIENQPDIILLQEIESLKVLEDIASSLNERFLWSCYAGNYGAALGIGIISKVPFGEDDYSIRAHSITIGDDTTPRPVLEVRIDSMPDTGINDPFVIFICHWKSKLGGEDATEFLRKASARVILRRMRELWENEPELGIIVAGDLNTNHDDFYRRGAKSITALVPDDDESFHLLSKEKTKEQNDFLVISGNTPPEPADSFYKYIVMFSPWMDDLKNGSYFYKNDWETIDHFLLSCGFFNGRNWEYSKAETVDYHPFADQNGTPSGYNVRTGYGLSDHLPLLLVLKNARPANKVRHKTD